MTQGVYFPHRHLMTMLGLICSAVTTAQIDPINDSTSARYRYEIEEYTIGIIPETISINEIDISERDQLKPRYRHSTVTDGVNNQYQPYFQVKNIENTQIEDWLSTPDFMLITPSNCYGMNSTGEVQFEFPSTIGEIQENDELASEYSAQGYRPIMLFFPNIHDEFVENSQLTGAVLYDLGNESFKLVWADKELLVQADDKSITSTIYRENKLEKTVTGYTLYAPYGYVVSYEYSETTRTDLANPVTFKTVRSFTNHVIEDINNMIPKYTDLANIDLYPVPVENEYEVVFKGVPEAQVSQVQIRDFMGNIIHTHYNPEVSNDVMILDGSSYPSGVLIIVVYTQYGVYTETFTKS